MNDTIVKDIWENGLLVPFDKRGYRMPLNKHSRIVNYIEGGMPEYLLVIVPERKQRRTNAFYANQTVTVGNNEDLYEYYTSLMLRGCFVDDWMPHLLLGGEISRVNSVRLTCIKDKLPVVVEGHIDTLTHMADDDKALRNYIFKLESSHCDVYPARDLELKFRPGRLFIKPYAIDNIQGWFRELLGWQNPRIEKLRKDIYSSFGLSVDPASLYPPATATYNRLIDGLKELDGKRAHPWLTRKHPWMSEDFIKKTFQPLDSIEIGYCKAEVMATMDAFRPWFKEDNMLPGIKKVIFNKPATIVLWEDGTKTIVRTQGKARFDKEKGLAMCIAKKALGNKGNYYDEFRKWVN